MVRDLTDYHLTEYRKIQLRMLMPGDLPEMFQNKQYAKGWKLTPVTSTYLKKISLLYQYNQVTKSLGVIFV